MLHTSAPALCALQIPNIAWALNANHMLLWLLVMMCCAINRECAKAPHSKCIASTKWTQTPGTPMLTTESWACCNQPSSNAYLKARCREQLPSGTAFSANTRLGGGTKRWHAACHKPAPAVRQQPAKLLAADAEHTARGMKAALPAPRVPHPRVRGVPPVSRGATAVQEGRWCGACRCAQGLLFHFHLSHPISTAVCHQRREN